MKILITGHTGFKGSWMMYWLQRAGHDVFGISHEIRDSSLYSKMANLKKDSEKSIICDIRNKHDFYNHVTKIQPELIFHLAAQPYVGQASVFPEETIDINLNGTINLLNAIESMSTLKGLVVITSDKVYRSASADIKFDEESPLFSLEPYGASKVMTELAISAWRTIKSDSLPPIAVARAGNIVGGGDDGELRLIPYINECIQKNSNVYLRNPKSTRPWTYVLDVINGYTILAEKLMNSSSFAQPWNFGPNTENSLNVEEATRIYLKARAKEHLEIIFQESKLYEQNYLSLNSLKSQAELGWHPVFSSGEALTEAAKWETMFDKFADLESAMDLSINNFQNATEAKKSSISKLLKGL
jgi:CDP-glucose 4,6-dehydratase